MSVTTGSSDGDASAFAGGLLKLSLQGGMALNKQQSAAEADEDDDDQLDTSVYSATESETESDEDGDDGTNTDTDTEEEQQEEVGERLLDDCPFNLDKYRTRPRLNPAPCPPPLEGDFVNTVANGNTATEIAGLAPEMLDSEPLMLWLETQGDIRPKSAANEYFPAIQQKHVEENPATLDTFLVIKADQGRSPGKKRQRNNVRFPPCKGSFPEDPYRSDPMLALFILADKGNDDSVTSVEIIQALKDDPELAEQNKLPCNINVADGSRDLFWSFFRGMLKRKQIYTEEAVTLTEGKLKKLRKKLERLEDEVQIPMSGVEDEDVEKARGEIEEAERELKEAKKADKMVMRERTVNSEEWEAGLIRMWEDESMIGLRELAKTQAEARKGKKLSHLPDADFCAEQQQNMAKHALERKDLWKEHHHPQMDGLLEQEDRNAYHPYAPALPETWTCPSCGAYMYREDRYHHLKDACSGFKKVWEAAFTRLTKDFKRSLLERRAIHIVQTRLATDIGAYCTLADCEGDEHEAIKRLFNEQYRYEMELAEKVIGGTISTWLCRPRVNKKLLGKA